MTASRVVDPKTTVLRISNGDTLTVKRRLNQGETRERMARMHRTGPNGELIFDRLMAGVALITAYLIDWTITGLDGSVIDINGKSFDEVCAALDSLDPDSFVEIREAIDAHDDAVIKERTEAKKLRDGESASSATSPSPSAATGPTTT